jgi:hypothetical protein
LKQGCIQLWKKPRKDIHCYRNLKTLSFAACEPFFTGYAKFSQF